MEGKLNVYVCQTKLQRVNLKFLTVINENDVKILPFYFFMHYTILKAVGIILNTNW